MSDPFDPKTSFRSRNESPISAGDSSTAQLLKLVLVLALLGMFFFSIMEPSSTRLESPEVHGWSQLINTLESAWQAEESNKPVSAEPQAAREQQRQRELASRRAEGALSTRQTTLATSAPATANPLQRLAAAVPLIAKRPFKPALNLSPDATDVQLGPQGEVVLSSKYAVVAYAAGNPNSRHTLLTPPIYSAAFGNDKYQAIRSALALPDGQYLFGGWHGLLLSRRGEQWLQLSGREQEPTGSIHALVYWQGAAYAAGRGLWRIDADATKPQPLAAFAEQRLRAVLATDESLFVANSSRVWQWRDGQARVVASDLPASLRITGLAMAPGQQLRILTNGGLYILDGNGRTRLEGLAGVWLRDAIQINKQLWLASWKQGLLMRENGRWHRYSKAHGLAGDAVTALTVDAQDHMWLALYGKGGWQAPRSDVQDRIRQLAWEPQADPN